MLGRRDAVDLFDQHPARRIAAGARAIDEDVPDGARDLRSIRLRVRQPCDELPIATREVRRQRAVDEDHGGANRSRRPASC